MFKSRRFRNGAGHDRQARGQVLTEFQGICSNGQFVHDKWENRNIEGLDVTRESFISLLAEQVYIGEITEESHVGGDLSDQREVPARARDSKEADELEVDPIRDQAEESDHRLRQLLHFIGNHRLGIASLAEMR